MKSINSKYAKKYSADILFWGSDAGNFKPFQTGFPTIDWINSGIGGFPRGGMTLIHGLESTGKSTLVLEGARFMIESNPETYILYIDVENSLTKDFLSFKKFDPMKLNICSLNSEDALQLAENALKENIYDMIVIDSLAKLESEKTMIIEMGESKQRSTRATMIADFLKRISQILRQSNTALICINQEMQNQNKRTPYDPDTMVPGGNQQFFSANLRLQLRRKSAIKSGEKKIGYILDVLSKKCKISNNENAKSQLYYFYGKGFSRERSLCDYLEMISYLKKGRGDYEFKQKELYAGKFKPDRILEIADEIKRNLGIDLYSLEPSDTFEFSKDGSVADPEVELGEDSYED
jgi:RecA/RadA recombinase